MRLIVDEPARGAWNMAKDDVLLSTAANDGVATLRFYGWSEPTLSLGYFQPLASRDEHAPSRNCAVVRRASGGGAILHDRELTYSLALPSDALLARDGQRLSHTELYRVVHETLITALAELGVPGARRYGVSPSPISTSKQAESKVAEPFLCFERRTEHDVVLHGAKIAGSAQRKRTSIAGNSAILQHGSILLSRSAAAPSLAGIDDLADVAINTSALIAAWQPRLTHALALHLESGSMSPDEQSAAVWIETEKFAGEAWLNRR